ncbi:hypothetical protein XELAEV_18026880mg [Xenopus laevis]|uniref:Uncharacterized protein n=1 Tax=Xenopus laevis TaxID=8355 RepID=A0A974HJ92_XENLA|nr:hypothetical protein XELAEV_18026880mg [Xenopus laevis]
MLAELSGQYKIIHLFAKGTANTVFDTKSEYEAVHSSRQMLNSWSHLYMFVYSALTLKAGQGMGTLYCHTYGGIY